MNEVDIAEKLQDHKSRIGSLEHRMDKAEKIIEEIRNMTTAVQLMAKEQKTTGEKVEKLVEKVDELEKAPGKNWTTVQTVVLTAVVTGIVSAIIASIINIM